MKRFLLLFIASTMVLVASRAQTINDENAEVRTVGSFHGIEVSTGIKLMLTEGATETVAVSAARPEFRDKIETKVVNGILKIHYNSEFGSVNKEKQKKELRAYVSYTKLDELEINTGAELEIQGVLKSPSLKMKANTGSEVKGKVEIGDMSVDQNTGSRVKLTGTIDKLTVDGDTGSKFECVDLVVNSCDASTSTGAQIVITVQKELSVKASTGGYVKYKGDASLREIKVNTGGQVTKI